MSLWTGLTLKSSVLWFLLAALSIAPLLPLSNFVGHPHWDHIRWIPFQDFALSRNMLKDIVGNTLWFMMFGYLLRCQLNEDARTLQTIATIIAITGGISLSTEFFQVFCHNRTASITDVICNVLGAGLGGYLAQRQRANSYGTITSDVGMEGNGSKTIR
jgi:glycopeptide antibiotics resistance protein